MPAALDVNWGEIKMLAINIGVREAARKMGLSEEMVKKRCTREGWLANLPRSQPLPPTMVRSVPGVPSGANVLLAELSELGKNSRIAVARGLMKGAKAIEEMDGKSVLGNAQEVKATVQSLSAIHGWANQAPTVKINLGATASVPLTMEAEIVLDNTQLPEDDILAGF